MPGADSTDNRPVAFINWFNAARFANWMANGQPVGPQDSSSTEDGAYSLNGRTSGNAVARNSINPNSGQAPAFYIPTDAEWFKAAYYSPTLNSGSGGYWYTPMQSNSDPGNQIGSQPNQGNFCGLEGYSVTPGNANFTALQNYLTNVGAFSGSGSFYGTFDQGGNVSEWTDLTAESGPARGLRGSNWSGSGGILAQHK